MANTYSGLGLSSYNKAGYGYQGYGGDAGAPSGMKNTTLDPSQSGTVNENTGVVTGTRLDGQYQISSARPDQTLNQRVGEGRADYLYGGTEGGAAAAAGQATQTGQQYGTALSNAGAAATQTGQQYGGLFMGAANRAATTGAQYGTMQSDLGQAATAAGTAAGTRATNRFVDPSAVFGANQAGSGMQDTAAQMKAIANMTTPSVAQAQLNQSTAAAMNQQLALARSGRGLAGSGASLRNAEANQAQIAGQADAAAATLRAQEATAHQQQELAAYGAAGGLQQGAGQLALGAGQYQTGALATGEAQSDAARLGLLNLGASQINSGAQTNLAGQQLGVQALGQGAQTEMAGNQLNLTGIGAAGQSALAGQSLANSINTSALGGTQAYEQNITNWRGQDMGIQQTAMNNAVQQQQIDQQKQAANESFVGSLISSGAKLVGRIASDRTVKTDIQPASAPPRLGLKGRILPGQDYDPVTGATLRSLQPTMVDQDAVNRSLARQALGVRLDGNAYTGSPAGAPIDQQAAIRGLADSYYNYDAKNAPRSPAVDAVRQADPYWFRYKDAEKYGDGQQFGIMAQDLAKTPAGRTAVERMPNGKLAINTDKLTTINTGALSQQQKQLDATAATQQAQGGALADLNAKLDAILKGLRPGAASSFPPSPAYPQVTGAP